MRATHSGRETFTDPADRFEVVVDGKVVDLVKADEKLVEVQTRNRAETGHGPVV